MKGNNTVTINQATMIEAMQLYFDAQLKTPHTVVDVKKNPNDYSGVEGFIVSFGELAKEEHP